MSPLDVASMAHQRLPTPRRICDFASDSGGNVLVMFALALPLLVGMIGTGVDYTLASSARSKMQGIADAAAVAAARELQIAKTDPDKISAVAKGFVNASLSDVSVTTNVDVKALTVEVILDKTVTPIMGSLLRRSGIELGVHATARMSGSLPLCLLGLDPSAPSTISLEKSALLTAGGCLVQSNSKSNAGIQSKNDATLKAGLICSVGGKVNTKNSNFSPAPTTDCPSLPDPLSARVPPSVGPCDHTDKVVKGTTETLAPGVYCGGLTVTGKANVTLNKGIFIFQDGPLVVNGGSSLTGTDIGIYLKGGGSNLLFDFDTSISLSAPKDGPLAGILIYDDPTGASAPIKIKKILKLLTSFVAGVLPREHLILSDDARNLLGTIYMPKARLVIDANQPIADKSAYTVLVVQQLSLYSGPDLILNSDYNATEVPVPMGLGPRSAKISLTK